MFTYFQCLVNFPRAFWRKLQATTCTLCIKSIFYRHHSIAVRGNGLLVAVLCNLTIIIFCLLEKLWGKKVFPPPCLLSENCIANFQNSTQMHLFQIRLLLSLHKAGKLTFWRTFLKECIAKHLTKLIKAPWRNWKKGLSDFQ